MRTVKVKWLTAYAKSPRGCVQKTWLSSTRIMLRQLIGHCRSMKPCSKYRHLCKWFQSMAVANMINFFKNLNCCPLSRSEPANPPMPPSGNGRNPRAPITTAIQEINVERGNRVSEPSIARSRRGSIPAIRDFEAEHRKNTTPALSARDDMREISDFIQDAAGKTRATSRSQSNDATELGCVSDQLQPKDVSPSGSGGSASYSRAGSKTPYFSKGDIDINNNMAGYFEEDMPIGCRTLAMYQLLKLVETGKPDYESVATPEKIENCISPEIEMLHKVLTMTSDDTELVDHAEWGARLSERFARMEKHVAGDRPARQSLLVSSSNHDMAMQLKIKQEHGKNFYSAFLFDPNLSMVHKRVKAGSLDEVREWTFSSLLESEEAYNCYFQEQHKVSVMHVMPSVDTLAERLESGYIPGNRVVRCLPSTLSATVMFHLVRLGCDGELRALQARLASEFSNLSLLEVEELLSAKGNDTAGLSLAIEDGHISMISAYAEIVVQSPLDRQKKFDLLCPRAPDGETPFLMLIEMENAEGIYALGNALALLEPTRDEWLVQLACEVRGGFQNTSKAIRLAARDVRNAAAEVLQTANLTPLDLQLCNDALRTQSKVDE